MSKYRLWSLAVSSLSAVVSLHAANYADSVVAYNPGIGAGSSTNSASALGEPSRQTADPQFGAFPVDPFGPPYLANQIVSLGTGGSLTLQFNAPVVNDPANPYGQDLIVFGNAFFQLNSDFITTSGALGGTNTGTTAVWVSLDGNAFYQLSTALMPSPDALYPTDGSGDFARPVNPALTGVDFDGKDLGGIRQLYAGSGGGTGFDISWALDTNGNSVALPEINYIRFDQLSGAAQIDGVSAVPEPSSSVLLLAGLGAIVWCGRKKCLTRQRFATGIGAMS